MARNHISKAVAVVAAIGCVPVCTAYAHGDISTSVRRNQEQQAIDFSRGAFSGRILDTDGKPIAGATVALQDKDGKVIAWTKTAPDGSYRMAAETLKALRLEPSRRKGFLEKVAGAAGQAIKLPVKMAQGFIGGVSRDPMSAMRAVANAGLTGNPIPLAGMVANSATPTNKSTPALSVAGERLAARHEMRQSLVPGEVVLLVNAPGFKPLRDKAGAYWMEPAIYSVGTEAKNKSPETGPQAFLETAKLAPADTEAMSAVEPSAILLVDAGVTPVLAAAGTTVRVATHIQAPLSPNGKPFAMRLFAREAKKGAFAELLPQPDGSWAGDLALDLETPDGDTTVSVVALRTNPVEVKVKRTETLDPLSEFARGLDEMRPGKEFSFDPRIFAAENRLEVALTVLDPNKATPTHVAQVAQTTPVAPVLTVRTATRSSKAKSAVGSPPKRK